jgi:GNAT superfamily N-acetyltransferase
MVIGLGQFCINELDNTAELALVVRDDFQGQGVGKVLHSYMSYLARRKGLAGFTAEVLEDNLPALGLITKMGFEVAGSDAGVLQMRMMFEDEKKDVAS